MKYRVRIKEKVLETELEKRSNGHAYTLVQGGRSVDFDYNTISPNWYIVTVGGKSDQVFVADTGQEKHVFVKGRSYTIKDAHQITPAGRRKPGPDETPNEVTPPMPSVVVRLLVKEGQMVEKGQGLVVVSAMKMETTLVAPYPGMVKKINTQVDAKVMPGDVLVEIEKQGEGNG